MNNSLFFLVFMIFLFSCKSGPDSDRQYAGKDRVYTLGIIPQPGSEYRYDITNSSTIDLEVDDKEINTKNEVEIGMLYTINKDSAGNILLDIGYDKIKLYAKTGDKETELDAVNASTGLNPVEKMLGALKASKINAVLNPKGEIISVKGYKEAGDKIIAEFSSLDNASRNLLQDQWEQLIGERMVKNNISELFNMFPDSAIHIGDKWRINTNKAGDVNLNAKTTFTLKSIDDNIATIESAGIITGDSTSVNLMGYKNVTLNLNGNQRGEYELDIKTGMVITSTMKSNVKGTVLAMGREIPLSLEASVKMKGKKIK